VQRIILHGSSLADDRILECARKPVCETGGYSLYKLFVVTRELSASPQHFNSMSSKQRASLIRRCKVNRNKLVEHPGSGDGKASEDSGDDKASEESGVDEPPEDEEDCKFLDSDDPDACGDSQEEFVPSDSGSEDDRTSNYDSMRDDSELDYDDSEASPDEYGVGRVPPATGKRTVLSSKNGPNAVCQQLRDYLARSKSSKSHSVKEEVDCSCTWALLCKQLLAQKR
jgi:hypothetical protein